jgi:hypothetical protein
VRSTVLVSIYSSTIKFVIKLNIQLSVFGGARAEETVLCKIMNYRLNFFLFVARVNPYLFSEMNWQCNHTRIRFVDAFTSQPTTVASMKKSGRFFNEIFICCHFIKC